MGPAPKEAPEKYCAYCGVKMERAVYKSKREDLGAFKRRKYCCRECMRKSYVKKQGETQPYSSAHGSSRKIAYMLEEREKICELCGSTTNVDIHHKDGNFHNNSSDNLMVVCRSCHMKLHRPKSMCRICGSPAYAHELCNKHYLRFKKYGDPEHQPWSTYRRTKQ